MKTARIYAQEVEQKTIYSILFTISFAHLLNDMMQSVIPSVYPLIKDKFGFTFAQIGIITIDLFYFTAIRRALHGQASEALFLGSRNGIYFGRIVHSGLGR